MIVSKRVSFDAAHFLPNHPGKCRNVHGHHWVIELGVEGDINNKTGMVVDFSKLKHCLESITEDLDHTLLNEVLDNPTAENLCLYVRDRVGSIGKFFSVGLSTVKFIRIWETEDSYAELS